MTSGSADQTGTPARVAVVTGRGAGHRRSHRLPAGGGRDGGGRGRPRGVGQRAYGRGQRCGGWTGCRHRADVTDERAAAAAVDRAGTELGPVAVLVDNAGIIRDNLLFKMSTDDWDSVRSAPGEPAQSLS